MKKRPDMDLMAETGSSEEAIDLVALLKPDVVIMDIDMPRISGLEVTRKIKEVLPNTEVLILINDDDKKIVLDAQQAGASVTLSKKAPGEMIIRTVQALAVRRSLSPRPVLKDIIEETYLDVETPPLNKSNELSTKEMSILKLVARGMSNKDIALHLGFSMANVKATLHTVFIKLQVSSRSEVIAAGLKTGMLTIKDLSNLKI
jgi:DNA-binding NarL/FixJ family response regulator